jgi:hypothetical protein
VHHNWAGKAPTAAAPILAEHYETLRACVLARDGTSGLRYGQGALMARGLAAWAEVAGELIPVVRTELSSSWEAPIVPQLVRDELIHVMGAAVMSLVRIAL